MREMRGTTFQKYHAPTNRDTRVAAGAIARSRRHERDGRETEPLSARAGASNLHIRTPVCYLYTLRAKSMVPIHIHRRTHTTGVPGRSSVSSRAGGGAGAFAALAIHIRTRDHVTADAF